MSFELNDLERGLITYSGCVLQRLSGADKVPLTRAVAKAYFEHRSRFRPETRAWIAPRIHQWICTGKAPSWPRCVIEAGEILEVFRNVDLDNLGGQE